MAAFAPLVLTVLEAEFGKRLDIHVLAVDRARPLDAEPGDVERREEDESQQRGHRQAAHDGVGHRPPEDGRRDRDMPRIAAAAVSRIGTEPMGRRLEDRVPR